MRYQDEQKWIATIRLQAQDGGDTDFYEYLVQQVNDHKDQWKVIDAGGDYTSDELTRLIQAAHTVIQFIEERKNA